MARPLLPVKQPSSNDAVVMPKEAGDPEGWKTRTVVLKRKPGPPGKTTGVGILLAKDPELSHFTVHDMQPDGPAALSGQIKHDDVLLAVDGVSVKHRMPEEVVDLLQGEPETLLQLTLVSDSATNLAPEPTQEHAVIAVRRAAGVAGEETGLGVFLQRLEGESEYRVVDITPDGPLGQNGRVKVGDTLLAIDGIPCGKKTEEEVVTLLRGEPSSAVQLTIAATATSVTVPRTGLQETESAQIAVVLKRSAGPAGSESGIGAFLQKREADGLFRVVHMEPGGPLARTGRAKVGDVLVSVDDVTLQDRSQEDLVRLVRGPPLSSVKLIISSQGGEALLLNPRPTGEPTSVRLRRRPADVPGTLTGIGALLIQLPGDDYFRVAGVDAAGPAGQSDKLRTGDLIVAVDGQSTARLRQDEVMRMVLGEPDTEVELSVAPGSKEDLARLLSAEQHKQDQAEAAGEGEGEGETHFFVKDLSGQRSLLVQRHVTPGPDGLSGIGIEIDKTPPLEHWIISDIDPAGPLGSDGRVQVGEMLVGVGGHPVSHLTGDEVVELIKGAAGSKVQLTLAMAASPPPSAQPRTLPLPAQAPPDAAALDLALQQSFSVTVKRIADAGEGSTAGVGLDMEQHEGEEEGFRVIAVAEEAVSTREVLRAGDLLLAVDGERLAGRDEAALKQLMAGEPESSVELTVVRDDKSAAMAAEAAARARGQVSKQSFAVRRIKGAPGERVGLGLTLHREEERGQPVIRVAEIDPEAACAGHVRVGDVLVALDGVPLDSMQLDAIFEQVRGAPESEVVVTVERDDLSRQMHTDAAGEAEANAEEGDQPTCVIS